MSNRLSTWSKLANKVRYLSKHSGVLQIPKTTFSTSFCHYNQEQEEDMDSLKNNPYFDKYVAKLKQKAEVSPEDFQAKVDEMEREKKKAEEETRKSLQEEREKQKAKATQRKAQGLDGVVKVELLQDKTADEITEIWTQYHSKKECIYAVIPKDEYEQIHSRSQEFPTFLYPLPRGTGYEFIVQQFDGQDCHFTPLVMFQRHQENAPTCLSITHYTELADTKGIVLMNSEVNKDIIGLHEAQLLALQLKMYYGVNAGLKINLLRMFKNTPDQFRHMDLVKEFEKYKQDFRDLRDGTWV